MKLLKQLRRPLYILGILAGGVFFILQAIRATQGVIENPGTFAFGHFLIYAFLIFCSVRGVQIIAWREILNGLRVRLDVRSVLLDYSLTFLPRYIPGSVWGYISRAEWLNKKFQVPYSVANYSSLIETGFVLFSFVQLALLFFALNAFDGIIRLLLIGLFVLSFFISWWLYSKFHQSRFFVWVLKKLNVVSIEKPVSFRSWLLALLLYLIAWFGFGLSTQAIVAAFSVSSGGNLLDFTYLYGLSWVTGFLVFFVPSGIGVREVAFSQITISMLGLSASTASLLAVLTRALILLGEITWVLGTLMVKLWRKNLQASVSVDKNNP